MRHLISTVAVIALFAPPLLAADGLSGAWTSGGTRAQTYVFKVQGDRFTLEASAPVPGRWDRLALRRIVENLASNAVKYGATDRPVRVAVAPLEGTSSERLQRAHLLSSLLPGLTPGPLSFRAVGEPSAQRDAVGGPVLGRQNSSHWRCPWHRRGGD